MQLNFSPSLKHFAEDICIIRSLFSSDVYKEGTDMFRGNMEHHYSMMGIWGEMIARDYLVRKEKKFKSAPLVDKKPVVGADIFMDGMKIDVKTINPKSNHLYVTKKTHDNPNKDVTHYWFILPNETTQATTYFVDAKEVCDWEVHPSKYRAVYRIRRK